MERPIISEENHLAHYGILRRSGRYPWGSGESTESRSRSFLGMVAELKKQGLSDTEIAKQFDDPPKNPFTTTDLRAQRTIALAQVKAANVAMAQRLKEKGYSNSAIAERMDLAGESSVRALLEPGSKLRGEALDSATSLLKDQVAEKQYLDVGVGVERHVGMSRTQFDTALAMLKDEGYELINVQVDQVGGAGQKTLIKVLAKEGTTYKDIVTDKDSIKSLAVNETGEGKFVPVQPPLSLSSKRVGIRYAEEGGTEADGVMYVRPGVKDISLGGSRYAQVRVAVDGTHYLKGMAVYKDDLPDGVDILFNTNKSDTGNKLDALKKVNEDPEDPFGAITRQIVDLSGKPTSAMNLVNEEGDWGNWSKSLASQMLSKQKPTLAQEQLDKTYDSKRQELDEILSLTNPSVKQRLLQSYSDDVDSASVHLKAAALPRQRTQVIMPLGDKNIKDTEIYAPNFRDGERVALIRYPHGGTFEIPELTVNNKNPAGQKLLGTQPKDAVGINSRVAERLSGADFDGDTVLVIPNNLGKVKSTPALEGLKGWDPKAQYKLPDDTPIKRMTPKQKQTEMGKASNLITDMTIKGASTSEIARAVRHSMVVIDAEKHNLDYRQSFKDNGIAQLKERYQSDSTSGRGASTLISRSTSEKSVNQRKMGYRPDPITGEKVYRETGESYVDAKGKTIFKTSKSTQGAEAKDAHSLSSGTLIEKVYADHSNRLKSLGNEARREMVATKTIPYSPTAKKVYASEVASLNAKLNVALKNAPLERQAQIVANALVKQKQASNPEMGSDELKKVKGKALIEARRRTGAGKDRVIITDTEWEAIQAGAISNNKLGQILNNTDLDRVKELATPRSNPVMDSAKQSRARALLSSGRTPSEVADILGVNVSTLQSSVMNEGS